MERDIIFLSEIPLDKDTLSRSPGIIEVENSNVLYEEFSVVPDPQWSSLEGDDLSTILYPIDEDDEFYLEQAFVALVDFPQLIREKLLELRNMKSCHAQDTFEFIENHLKTRFFTTEIFPLGISCSLANMPTITFNNVTQKYTGLHLDNWDALPLEHRHLARNRICINIGTSTRYFLFINLSVNKLADKCSKPLQSFESDTDLISTFFSLNPNYPVLRVRVLPGQAYIAPTDYIIHDAYKPRPIALESAVEVYGLNTDITLTLLGRFKVAYNENFR